MLAAWEFHTVLLKVAQCRIDAVIIVVCSPLVEVGAWVGFRVLINTVGAIAVGAIAVGAIAVGAIAVGAIAVGAIAVGAIAVGVIVGAVVGSAAMPNNGAVPLDAARSSAYSTVDLLTIADSPQRPNVHGHRSFGVRHWSVNAPLGLRARTSDGGVRMEQSKSPCTVGGELSIALEWLHSIRGSFSPAFVYQY